MQKNPHLEDYINEVVNTQIEENDPPETKITLERLIKEGHSKQKAKELIGFIVTAEIYDTLKEGRPYNEKTFLARLEQLPDTSFLNE